MHIRHHRGIHGVPPRYRASRQDSDSDSDDDDDGPDADISPIPFPGPVTITVVETVSATQSSSITVSAPATTSTTSSATPGPTSSPPPPPPVPSPPPPLPQAATTPLPVSSTASPLTIPTPAKDWNNMPPQTTHSTRLSSGGIAGIVIAILILSSVALFFALRRQFRRNRMKLRSVWTRARSVTLCSPFEPKGYPGMQASPGSRPDLEGAQGSRVSAAHTSYNNPANTSATPRSTLLSFATVAPVYSPDFALSSPVSATVVSAFITSLPDELAISVGETIRVMAEYDDGWALCINARGEQGMVPQECLNQGASSIRSLLPPPRDFDARSTKRTSSLDPRRMDKT